MYKCTCCNPEKTYSSKKALEKHRKKYDLNYISGIDIIKANKENKIAEYYSNPRLCLECNNSLSFEDMKGNKKFCNQSCSGSYNGRAFPKRSNLNLNTHCKQCRNEFSKRWFGREFCSGQCHKEYRQETIEIPKFLRGEITSRNILKKHLVRLYGWQCSDCKNKEWKNEAIPIELDHIDGNAGNNSPENLRLMCPNCHAMTPTAKGKNKGYGRKSRGILRK